ncbi:MAG: TrmH family RNA methyltransferase [Limisphaerales bacterium]
MPKIIPVDTLDVPDLAPYRTMRRHQAQRADGVFVAEGPIVVRRLLESGLDVVNLLMPAGWAEQLAPLVEARAPDAPVFVADLAQLETLTGFTVYQGVLALGRIPPVPSLGELLQALPRPRFIVALDGLANAENVGAAARNAAAFGAQALLAGETCASPWLRRSVRAAMGTLFRLPVIESAALADHLAVLRAAGFICVAADPHSRAAELPSVDLRGDCCLVLGAEGDGLRPAVQAACDVAACVPMAAGVESLNVASAAAVFAYEAWRQRRPRA